MLFPCDGNPADPEMTMNPNAFTNCDGPNLKDREFPDN